MTSVSSMTKALNPPVAKQANEQYTAVTIEPILQMFTYHEGRCRAGPAGERGLRLSAVEGTNASS